VRQAFAADLAKPDVTTESFRGTVSYSRLRAFADPSHHGAGDREHRHQPGRPELHQPADLRPGAAVRVFETSAGGQPYSTVTASLPDGSLSVTVWAMARPLSISAGTPDATLYTRGCGYLGSTATARQMASTGANQPIDCGVTYLRPGTGFGLTASVGWQTYWAITTGDGDGPLPPDPGMQPLNNGQLLPSTAGRQVSVGEIQSLNGG
jgi:hypothetical protein